MRIYYVFNIKKDVLEIYEKTPSVLYNFLNQLYYLKKDSLDYCNMIFRQVADYFDKDELDLDIYLKLHNKMRYVKKSDDHIINNFYKDEVSIMKVKKSYIIINSNKKFTEFFPIINEVYKNCLVCDFNNQDYFYLRNIKTLV